MAYDAQRTSADSALVPKLSYVQRVPGWEWDIAAGVYLDDITAAFWQSLVELGGLLLGIGLLLTLIMGWIIRGVLGSLGGDPQHAQDVVHRIASGDLTQLTPGPLDHLASSRHRLVGAKHDLRQKKYSTW